MYNHFVFWWVWSRKEIVALLITFLPIYGWTVTLSCFQSPNFYFNSETAQCLLMKTQSVPGIIWTRIRFAVCLRRVRTACVTFVLYVHMKPSFYIIKKMTEAEGTFCSPATVAARTRESSIINIYIQYLHNLPSVHFLALVKTFYAAWFDFDGLSSTVIMYIKKKSWSTITNYRFSSRILSPESCSIV